MNTILIIKGADFSQVAIEQNSLYGDIALEQNGLNLITTSGTFGEKTSSSNAKRINSVSTFFWEKGSKMLIKGLKGVDGSKNGLKLDGAYYKDSVISHTNVVGTMNGSSTNYFPFNTKGNDEVEIENIWGNYYFAFSLADSTDMNLSINYADYSPLKYLVRK